MIIFWKGLAEVSWGVALALLRIGDWGYVLPRWNGRAQAVVARRRE